MVTTRPRRRLTPSTERRPGVTPVAVLSLAALGVVFGDIGTSPLYAFRLRFLAGPGYAARAENVLGILSLIVWALILVVCVKYATFVLRADYEGEGGTLALLALLLAPIPRSCVSKRFPGVGCGRRCCPPRFRCASVAKEPLHHFGHEPP